MSQRAFVVSFSPVRRKLVTKGVHVGTWVGRVAVRASGSFNIKTASGNGALPSSAEMAMVIRQQEHRADARSAIPPGPEGPGFSRRNGDIEGGCLTKFRAK